MAGPGTETSQARIEWDAILPGAELAATVLMASGFALQEGQHVQERYRVERRLGEGGMGQVLAVSLLGTSDDQIYALKVVARNGGTGSDVSAEAQVEAERQAKWFAELLRSEAAKQEVAQRQGVAVARLFALVQLGDGSLGLRMELARGRSLEAKIAGHKRKKDQVPDVAGAVRAVRKLLSQLRRLHEMVRADSPFGFVHSDIKPGNVFVDDTDPSDVIVTILDFGVATAGQAMAHSMAGQQSRRKTLILEHTGGTLGYVPPHHFSNRATPLSDVYASLVMLYELIALALPWDLPGGKTRPSVVETELAMERGPRPVQKVRPSVSDREAAELDAFFAREFRALGELAAHAAQALALDDAEVKRAVVERLRALARDYQTRLDRLLSALGATTDQGVPVRSAAAEDTSASPEELGTRPTVLSDSVPSMGPSDGAAVDAGWHDAPRSDRSRGETRVILADDSGARPPSEMRWGDSRPPRGGPESPDALSEPSAMPIRPRGGGGAGWLVFLLSASVVAGGGYYVYRTRYATGGATQGPALRADAAVVGDANALALAAPPDGSGAAVGLPDDAADATVVAAADDAAAHPGAVHEPVEHAEHAAEARGQPCRCVAPARGVSVIARGGSLTREVVLCTTSAIMVPRPDHFVGNGEVPPEVAAAHATLLCRGAGGTFEVTTLPFQRGGRNASLFECERASPGPGGGSGSGGGADGGAGGGAGAATGAGPTGVDNNGGQGGSDPVRAPPAEGEGDPR